jgi:hypothetical protein
MLGSHIGCFLYWEAKSREYGGTLVFLRGHPPGPPVSLKGYPRPVNSRMVKEREFTGPKVIKIICQDHVILDLSLFSIAPTVSKPRMQGRI